MKECFEQQKVILNLLRKEVEVVMKKSICILSALVLVFGIFCSAFTALAESKEGDIEKDIVAEFDKNHSMSIVSHFDIIEEIDDDLYGGIYIDSNGNLNILTVDGKFAQAKELISSHQKSDQTVIYRTADFSMKYLFSVKDELFTKMEEYDIIEMGIDEINNKVYVGIQDLDEIKEKKVREILNDEKCVVIKSADNMVPCTTHTMKNGSAINIGNTTDALYGSMALGIKFTHNGTDRYGYLTAGHNYSSSYGSNAYLGDGISKFGDVIKYQWSGSVDAALIERKNTSSITFYMTNKFIDDTGYTTGSISYAGGDFAVGTKVWKYGRNGYGFGYITDRNYSYTAGGVKLTDMVMTDCFASSGDSGGAVKVDYNAGGLVYTYATGIVQSATNGAGNMSYTKMTNAKSALGFDRYIGY